jgi:hypothetical protein
MYRCDPQTISSNARAKPVSGIAHKHINSAENAALFLYHMLRLFRPGHIERCRCHAVSNSHAGSAPSTTRESGIPVLEPHVRPRGALAQASYVPIPTGLTSST